MKTFLSILLFTVGLCTAKAQVTIDNTPPIFVSACQDSYTYAVTVNAAATPVNNGQLTYSLPAGLLYMPGTVTNAVTEANIANLNSPVFDLPASLNSAFTFEFMVRSTCDLAASAGTVQDNIVLQHQTTEAFLGKLYNVNPIVAQANYQNFNNITNVGDVSCFDATVTVPGFEAVNQLFLSMSYDQTALDVVNVSPGVVLSTAPTTVVMFDETINPGESVVLTHCFQLLACGDYDVEIDFAWGCEETICETFNSYTLNVSTEPTDPYFQFTANDYIYATPCEPGSLSFTLRNAGQETNPGAANIYDVRITLDWETWLINGGIPVSDECADIYFFVLGDTLPASAITPTATGYIIDCTQFDFDPDIPGAGLEDLDGDGFYDDIRRFNALEFTLGITFDASCLPTDCNQSIFDSRMLVANVFYRDQCDSRTQEFPTGYEYEIGANNPGEVLSTQDVSAGDFDVVLYISPFTGGLRECNDSNVTVAVVLPPGVGTGDDFTPLFSGDTVNWDVSATGDTVWVDINSFEGQLYLPLEAFCDSVIIPPPGPIPPPCMGTPSAPPPIFTIQYWVEFFCTPECDEPFVLYCDQTPPFALNCPSAPTVSGPVIPGPGFRIERVNYGFTDETCTVPVDPTSPGIANNVGMTGDTVKVEINAQIYNMANADTSNIVIAYPNFTGIELLEFDYAKFTLFDSETGDAIECDFGVPDSSYIINNEYRYSFSLLDMVQPGGCLDGYNVTEDDQMLLEGYFIVSDAVPSEPYVINNLMGFIEFIVNDTAFDCGGQSGSFMVFNPSYEFTYGTKYSGQGCDNIEIALNYFQTAEIGESDPFPYEHRPIISWDEIVATLPPTMTFVPGSARFWYRYRELGAPSTPIYRDTINIPDPTISFNGDFTFENLSGLPCVDLMNEDSSRAGIIFEVSPTCIHQENQNFVADIFYQERAYLNEGSIPAVINNFTEPIDFSYFDIQFYSLTPLFQGTTDTASYTLILSLSSIADQEWLPNVRIMLELQNDLLDPQVLWERLPNGTKVPYALNSLGDGLHFWFNIDTLFRYEPRTFDLTALFDVCEPMQFTASLDFSCAPYPDNPFEADNPCNHQIPTELLSLNPQQPDFQANEVSFGLDSVALCQPEEAVIHIINAGIGGGLDPTVFASFPGAGIEIIPGTSTLCDYAGNCQDIADPILSGNVYEWEIEQYIHVIKGSQSAPDNQLFLSFFVETTCDFDPQSVWSYWVEYNNVCDEDVETVEFFTFPPQIVGAPQTLNEYVISSSPGAVSACTGGSETFTFTIVSTATNDPTSDVENIRLTMPGNFTYQANSFQNILNMPGLGEPDISMAGGNILLEWELPNGVMSGDSMIFSIDLSVSDDEDCAAHPFSFEIVEVVSIPCGSASSGFCFLDFAETLYDFSIQVEKPQFGISAQQLGAEPFSADQERWDVEITLENLGTIISANNLTIQVFYDVNGNGIYDAGVDELFTTLVTDVSSLGPGGLLNLQEEFLVDLEHACEGLVFVVDSQVNSCLCNGEEVSIGPPALSNTGDDVRLCDDESYQLSIASQPGYSYNWNSPYVDNPSAANPIFHYTANIPTGDVVNLPLILETTRPGGCSSTDTVFVTIAPLTVTAEIIQGISCTSNNDGILEAKVVGGYAPIDYSWNTGSTDLTLSGLSNGTYVFIASDDEGCADTAVIELQEPNAIEVDLLQEVNVTCFDGTDGALSVELNGGTQPYTILWNTGSTETSLTNLTAGTYTVSVSDANGCEGEFTSEIIEPDPWEYDINSVSPTCPETADGLIEIAVIDPGSSGLNFSLNGGDFQSETIFEELEAGNYQIIIIDGVGCTLEENVVLDAPFNGSLVEAPEDRTIFLGDSTHLVPELIHPSVTDIEWSPGIWLDCTDCPAPWAKPDTAMAILYEVTVKNSFGCEEKDQVIIKVELPIYIPNAFSPNADGLNDGFTIYSGKYAHLFNINDLLIFDRWGNQVFENSDFPTDNEALGWDGKLKGKIMNPAVFVYWTELTYTLTGSRYFLKGDVHLVRGQ
ncbi:MAG: gliding motility-associated C-terminal domain-containing protein [Bacteroidota bacterium]